MTSSEVRIRDRVDELASETSGYFSTNSKSFSFAARLFPSEVSKDVTAVYAFCRFTDDLVDDRHGVPVAEIKADLAEWLRLARQAHAGNPTGLALLDGPMATARRLGIPFNYADDLVRGVGMDIEPRTYGTLEQLEVYTHRVAGVVGQWLTELFGVRDPDVLASAAQLGNAMQLTNILRDVGEDFRMGRIYLPLAYLDAHGVSREWLDDAASGRTLITTAYAELLERVMEIADRRYSVALAAVPALPSYAQRAVVVAAQIYRAIQAQIRRNGYDNLTRRAVVSGFGKKWRAVGALASLPVLRLRHRKRRRVES